jgi:P63C domain-containing protein
MNDTPQSKGGRERAKRLSPNERTDIAKKAAEARWARYGDLSSVPRAICGGPDKPLRIGDVEIPCYVLEGGRRVIHQRGMVSALGMSRGGSSRGGGDRLAHFVAQKTLSPYVSKELVEVTGQPLVFRTMSGSLAYGYDATVLAEICESILEARKEGVLSKQQEHLADKAEILIRAFARVGVIALIDEATGYQKIRARDELQQILTAYIAEELLPWSKQFPDSFYEQLYRVRGWDYRPGSNKRTAYVGKLTNLLIYEQLPPGVLEELKKKNPVDPATKRRRKTHHQHLSEEVGHPHLQKQINAITTLLRASPDGKWGFFQRLFNTAFPPKQRNLFEELDTEYSDESEQ